MISMNNTTERLRFYMLVKLGVGRYVVCAEACIVCLIVYQDLSDFAKRNSSPSPRRVRRLS